LPNSQPPVVIVRFDPAQTSAEAIVQAAKAALETDPFNPRPVAVTLEYGPVEAPPALVPIVRFTATDLWVRALATDTLRLNTELFGCGTCSHQVIEALQRTPGVIEARSERSAGGPAVLVTYDPAATTPEQLGEIARQALEGDPFLPVSVAVHFVTGP
jgi:copper chaperone CopZ